MKIPSRLLCGHFVKRLGLFLLILTFGFAAPAPAAGKKYVIGAIKGMINEASSQSGSLIADMVKPLSAVIGAEVEMAMYDNLDALMKAAGKKEVDFALLFDYTPIFGMMAKTDFTPFVGYTLLGMKETRGCLYYKAGKEVKSVADLKGASMITYDTDYEYYLLRNLVGDKPETFFGSLKKSPSGVASIYNLSADGDNDAALVWEQNVAWVQISNPQAVKKLRQLTCTETIPFYPLLASSAVSAETIKKMQKFFINSYNEPSMERFKPLMRQFKIKFLPVAAGDFGAELKLFKNAVEKGWDKDFQKWVKSATMIEEKIKMKKLK